MAGSTSRCGTWISRGLVFGVPAIFALYLGETLMRVSQNPFLFHELCTLYIVRLPGFAASRNAFLDDADYNPPFFCVIQRAGPVLFGDGPTAFRLRAMPTAAIAAVISCIIGPLQLRACTPSVPRLTICNIGYTMPYESIAGQGTTRKRHTQLLPSQWKIDVKEPASSSQ